MHPMYKDLQSELHPAVFGSQNDLHVTKLAMFFSILNC